MASNDSVMNGPGLELLASLEQQFVESKTLHLKGKARVRLSQLSFPNPIRPIDPNLVKVLKRTFKSEGCLQQDSTFSLPAIIDDNSLTLALEGLGVGADRFKADSILSPAKFELPHNIQLACLHGLDDKAQQLLREGRTYSTNYTDGEIFCQIILCRFQNKREEAARWRARITANKEGDLGRLLKRWTIINALESIIQFRGYWNAFHLGSLDILLSIKCDEEIACYIKQIKDTITHIIGDNSLIHGVDRASLDSIQLRAPAISKMDSQYIEAEMLSDRLFPAIKDPATRSGILQRLLGIEQPILSIYTLFKDLRYLDPAARAMRALLPKRSKESLRVSFFSLFRPDGNREPLDIQDSEISYTTVSGDHNYLFGLAYRELFLGAIRYFTNTSNVSSKKDMNPIEQNVDGTKRYLGFRLLEFGQRIGFSIQTDQDALIDPSERLLADMLRSLPREIFNVNEPIPDALSALFKGYLSNSTLAASAVSRPSITTLKIGEPLSHRCGRYCGGSPDDEDRLHLFIRKMHAPLSKFPRGGHDISSFYVKTSKYQAFFGEAVIREILKPVVPGGTGEGISETSIPSAADDTVMTDGRIFTNLLPQGGIQQSREVNTDFTSQPNPTGFTHGNTHGNTDGETPKSSGLNVEFVTESDLVHSMSIFTRSRVEARAKTYAKAGLSLMDERGRPCG
ncbi:hypothetical protein VC83_06258 [Pseudogymnoascus destructans]|uniref:Uncharacterized protein n=1 Tax=Pseudogymnoascus destructans TaxID=655981 RepID=A0A177ACK8_9PEZI|nr:uncharacterized protein VC83_06258 [Pseudogymnoascus destructans]OAF58914.1 hypothetical protein VC83_06258 [Pseudogymnoascus destructans]